MLEKEEDDQTVNKRQQRREQCSWAPSECDFIHMARPHIRIPPGAAPPAVPCPAIDDFITVTPADHDDDFEFLNDEDSPFVSATPRTTQSRSGFPVPRLHPFRSDSRPASVHEQAGLRIPFPEPNIPQFPERPLLRASSHTDLGHRSTKSDTMSARRPSISREESRPPSYISNGGSPKVRSVLSLILHPSNRCAPPY